MLSSILYTFIPAALLRKPNLMSRQLAAGYFPDKITLLNHNASGFKLFIELFG